MGFEAALVEEALSQFQNKQDAVEYLLKKKEDHDGAENKDNQDNSDDDYED